MYKDFNNYDVLPSGRIWSKYSKKFLKPKTEKNGYQRVCLVDDDGKKHFELLHKIVFFAVNGLWKYPEGMELNHIDEDKTNNHISNLELVTPKQNINHGTRTERAAKARINHPEMSKRVAAYKDDVLVMAFPSTREAHRNGYNHGAVAACCRNCYIREGNNLYKGYVWRFLED